MHQRVLAVGAIGKLVGDCLKMPGIELISKHSSGVTHPGAQPGVLGLWSLYFWTSLGRQMPKRRMGAHKLSCRMACGVIMTIGPESVVLFLCSR